MTDTACSFCGLETEQSGVVARNGRRICRTCLDVCGRLPVKPVDVHLDLYPVWDDVDPEIKEVVAHLLAMEVERIKKNIERAEVYHLPRFEARMKTAATVFLEAISALMCPPVTMPWTDAPVDRREPVIATLIKSSYTSRGEASQCEVHRLPAFAHRHREIERAFLSAAGALGWDGPSASR